MESVIGEPAEDRPVVSTFAAQVPFPLRLATGSEFTYGLEAAYANAADAEALFPGQPWVRIRAHNQALTRAGRTRAALKSLYGQDIEYEDWLPEGAYVQWVSLETPSFRLTDEAPEDGAFAFHRCLGIFDVFLRAHNMAFRDPAVYPISTKSLDPTVIIGHFEPDGSWQMDAPMLVHPERLTTYQPVEPAGDSTVEAALNGQVAQLLSGHPMLKTFSFMMRADRAGRLEGDAIDEVVSLQTAMESRLFAIWRLILVDQGMSSTDIDAAVGDQNFSPLVKTKLPQLLGGRWDTTARHTTVGQYWHSLYELRNRVVHAGYEPHLGEAETARNAYQAMRRFARDRVWEKRRRYPRTAVAVLGFSELTRQQSRDRAFESQAEKLMAEPEPYFLPWDVAGRTKP